MFNHIAALNVAAEFTKKANPDFWNGKGDIPDNFSTLIHTFDIGFDDIELDISFEYRDYGYEDEIGWGCYCELRCKEDGYLLCCIFEFGIDSVYKLATSIMETVYGTHLWKALT